MFSKRLLLIRVQRGLSQVELAERAGIGENAVWRYESGETEPKGEVIARLAKELDVSTDYLLGLTEYPGQYVEGPLSAAEREAIAAWRRGDKYEAIEVIVKG